MGFQDLFQYVIYPLVIVYLGWNEKDKMSMKSKIYQLPEREEIVELIDLKMSGTHIETRELKENLRRIEGKLDKIIDKMTD